MEQNGNSNLISSWLTLTSTYTTISNELEAAMQREHQLSLKEFYVLLFLNKAPEKKLKLQQLQNMVGLSQSAMSRLVARFEAKGCGALKRESCPHDRRNIYTSITEIGKNKFEGALITFQKTLASELHQTDFQNKLEDLLLQNQKNM
ncbi:MarR family winged helix-turn-helix transcriptional regulator [Aquibacillus albus]|uniref:DNA-binding MarR family transcriptional regulator n=1 Tax=Aquibacillus albus TaxID=1168171 RepID=A0ABS2N5C2_9BACI|nr:MarR family transcriptional regulator [Aquibacillus albus]MBM7573316.1 DNA-binding MarR family transcriptional regulator [Aquibacillus albus]